MKKSTMALCSLAAILAATPVMAAEQETPFADRLLGNAGGVRDALANIGADVSVLYSGTAWHVDGGLKNGSNYEHLVTARLDVDGEKAYGLRGNSISVAAQSGVGGHPNTRIGSIEDIDNNAENPNAVRLYEAYVMQTFLDESLTALVGVRDLNADFVWTDMTANFIKPTFQIGQELAQTGQNGPSIFPFTGLAATLKYAPANGLYVQGGAFDGVPMDQDHARSTRVDPSREDGALLIAEAGYAPRDNSMNKIGVGVWSYTTRADDLVDTKANGDPEKHHTNGAYIVSSYQFYNDEVAGRSVGAFFRYGMANDDAQQTDWNYQAGLVANGWVPGRADGEIGFGFTQAHNSDKYRSANTPTDASEHGFELYYLDQLTPAITVQPDLQYIVNPGTDTVTDDAAVVGLRVNVSF